MNCRIGCGACCIAVSISTPLPGHPEGKPAGERCRQLDMDYRCRLHGTQGMPLVCSAFRPEPQLCGTNQAEALAYLAGLEASTAPGVP